ncbi:hypothetical protein [Tumebacillus permanentifrigoris]|uniref:Uncharacterized protein n=1 Tax=Tumebacillus permanentifrigoris TaxID=378543 RepID=A0A316D5P7_9BACL|nr:hypothetical protein [Tumebacillus permanentifrigoris]PWK07042.1 hypothetical protein C7459_118118 [Tumebacillus permanentifrigoris]
MSQENSKLKHLSTEQVEDLMARYYDGEKISELLKEFSIKCSPSVIHAYFPQIVEEYLCPYCSVNLLTKRVSRNNKGFQKAELPKCPVCKHTEGANYCSCVNCRELSARLEEERLKKKKEKIKETYDLSKRKPIDVSQLTRTDRLYLSALLRSGFDENFQVINPVQNYIDKLSPTEKFCEEIVKTLTSKAILVVHPMSEVASFPDNEEFPNSWYTYLVYYHVNVSAEGVTRSNLLQELMNPPSELYTSNPYYCFEIWRKIAIEECCQYLLHHLSKLDFQYKVGEKTIAIFQELLETFSVSQIYNIVNRQIANASRYYQEKRVSKMEAANTVIGSCLRFGERARAEKWDIYKYGRDYSLPQTVISELVYNRILQLGVKGFDLPPDLSEFIEPVAFEDQVEKDNWNPNSQAKFTCEYNGFKKGDIALYVGRHDDNYSVVCDRYGDQYLVPHYVIQVKITNNYR